MKLTLKIWETDTLHAIKIAQSTIKADARKIEKLQTLLSFIESQLADGETEVIISETDYDGMLSLYP